MPTFMQKIRLTLRGWQRRREERERDFVARSTSWGTAASPTIRPAAKAQGLGADVEGLTVAYLDESGRLAHFLDAETGDIVDVAIDASLAPPRYRRVPSRSVASDAADRLAFLASLEPSRARDAITIAAGDGDAFRHAVAADRTIERAWYNFRNDRAIAAIEAWLGTF